MTHIDVPAASTPPGPQALPVAAPRSWPWRRAALLLAGAAVRLRPSTGPGGRQ